MTRKELEDMGFEFEKTYLHDNFTTIRHKKGIITTELTYLEGNLNSFDITIEEVNCLKVRKTELLILDNILNGKNG